jgi:hypothetical protein
MPDQVLIASQALTGQESDRAPTANLARVGQTLGQVSIASRTLIGHPMRAGQTSGEALAANPTLIGQMLNRIPVAIRGQGVARGIGSRPGKVSGGIFLDSLIETITRPTDRSGPPPDSSAMMSFSASRRSTKVDDKKAGNLYLVFRTVSSGFGLYVGVLLPDITQPYGFQRHAEILIPALIPKMALLKNERVVWHDRGSFHARYPESPSPGAFSDNPSPYWR